MRTHNAARSIRKIVCAFAILAVALFFLSSAGDAQACSVKGGFRMSSEGPWLRFMDLESGGACGNSFRSFGTLSYTRLYLVTPPQHGAI